MQLPKEFCQRMQPLLGDQWATFIDAYDRPLRRGLRINQNKISIDEFLSIFPHHLSRSPFATDCFYLDSPHKAGSDPLHHAGAYYMQEPSAASAVTVLDPKPHQKILDLCAAPGGKSTQILAALGDSGLLWSNEYIPTRARILEQNLERCGARRHVISSSDTANLCHALSDYFDAVLVDAPCSGEGMFRKEPQALSEWSIDNIRLCAARQTDILDNAACAVRPDGLLVYSTCTFAPEENEAVIARFLLEHPEFILEKIDVPWGVPAFPFDTIQKFSDVNTCTADLTHCRRIFPQHGGEGHFIARMRRSKDVIANPPYTYTPPTKDTNRSAAQDLYADCFITPPQGVFVTFGSKVHLLPPELPNMNGLKILSAGVVVADVCKNRLEPCHGAFLAANADDCRRSLRLAPDDPRLYTFLRGEELPLNGTKGWTAVCVGNIPLGFGKNTGDRLKNRYPKGLRLL